MSANDLSRRGLLSCAGAALAAACASGPRPSLDHPARMRDDPRVGVFVSSPWGFTTSSYWIEGPDGLVLIDAQFLPSAARRALDLAESVTGKRAVLCVVLHANPDKYNGVGVYRDRGVRVVSARQVVERIPVIDVERRASFAARYAPDYPERLALPDAFGDSTQSLSAAGLRLNAHVLGPGCSNAHVVVEWEGHVFTGDLVANRNHSWLKEADIDGWVQRMSEVRELRPRWVHPGRGPTGGSDLLDDEVTYLRFVQGLVRETRPRSPADPEAIAEVRRRVEARYPGYGFPVFLALGVAEEYRRQAERNRSSSG